MKRKLDIDIKVATILNKPTHDVAIITNGFLQEVMNTLISDGEVHVDGFGKFKLQIVTMGKSLVMSMKKGNFKTGQSAGEHKVLVEKKYRVNFKKAAPFRERIRRKYGKAKIVEEPHGEVRR